MASWLGMLPGTVVFVNAGNEISEIEDVGDILSIGLIAAFISLGLVPLIIKKLLNCYKKRKQKKINNASENVGNTTNA